MPARAQWDDEESDSSSSGPASPAIQPVQPVVRRNKFDDEEGEDSDVLDSWDAAEDSEVEREKAKKAEEAKAKAEEEAKANKKSKAQRIEEKRAARAAALAEESGGEEGETEAEKRERLRRTEKDSDLKHAEDLFDGVGVVPAGRKATTIGTAIPIDAKDPNKTVNISELPLFNPLTKTQFEQLRNTLGPIISAHSKRPHYALFLQEFTKQLAKDLPSDSIKKIASTMTALSNEKMREEKASQGGKKSKAAKTKSSLVATRADVADTQSYGEEAFGDDDFM